MSGGAAGAGSAVAVGVFDGLHLGHVEILARALSHRPLGGRAVVLSFDPHPDLVLAKVFQPVAPLTPQAEKRERVRELGLDALDVVPFTRELAALPPDQFVEEYLIRRHALRVLVVGENFALGRARRGDLAWLREYGAQQGFEVEAVPLLEREGEPITSTRVRVLLGEGRVAQAARLLGRRYSIAGRVVTGQALGRELGFPTANLQMHEEKFVPAHGIYAVWVRLGAGLTPVMGAMSIGVRPTFGGTVRTLEVFLLDWSGHLVGESLEVEFADWIRPERTFENAAALVAEMERDVAEVRRRLAVGP
ncbi:MAG: bifunctional riboflavin kinase/FAD synthetase [Candidatus Eisenbacteria bacterium]